MIFLGNRTDSLSRSYDKQDLTLTLPEGKTLKQVRWMSLWNRALSVSNLPHSNQFKFLNEMHFNGNFSETLWSNFKWNFKFVFCFFKLENKNWKRFRRWLGSNPRPGGCAPSSDRHSNQNRNLKKLLFQKHFPSNLKCTFNRNCKTGADSYLR